MSNWLVHTIDAKNITDTHSFLYSSKINLKSTKSLIHKQIFLKKD